MPGPFGFKLSENYNIVLNFMHTQPIKCVMKSLTFRNAIKVWAWKPKLTKMRHCQLWNNFIFNEVLVLLQFSEILRKLTFKTFIWGPSRNWNFALYSVFLFVFVKRSTFKLKLSRISKFKKVANQFDEFVIFTKNFNRSVQSSSRFAQTFLYEWETC